MRAAAKDAASHGAELPSNDVGRPHVTPPKPWTTLPPHLCDTSTLSLPSPNHASTCAHSKRRQAVLTRFSPSPYCHHVWSDVGGVLYNCPACNTMDGRALVSAKPWRGGRHGCGTSPANRMRPARATATARAWPCQPQQQQLQHQCIAAAWGAMRLRLRWAWATSAAGAWQPGAWRRAPDSTCLLKSRGEAAAWIAVVVAGGQPLGGPFPPPCCCGCGAHPPAAWSQGGRAGAGSCKSPRRCRGGWCSSPAAGWRPPAARTHAQARSSTQPAGRLSGRTTGIATSTRGLSREALRNRSWRHPLG